MEGAVHHVSYAVARVMPEGGGEASAQHSECALAQAGNPTRAVAAARGFGCLCARMGQSEHHH
eukprot:10273257-Karenia_brevis.AAC.1